MFKQSFKKIYQKMPLMHLEDEFEFYEFDPYSFLKKIPDLMEDTIRDTLECVNIAEKVKRELRAHFTNKIQKNFILFEDFSISQIFSFPTDFVYERKLTDEKFHMDFPKSIENITKLKNECNYYRSELDKTNKSIILQKKYIKDMQVFLENPDVNDIQSNMEFLIKWHRETKKAFGKHTENISDEQIEKFDKLLENKKIKTQMKIEELNKQHSVGTLDDLDAFRNYFVEMRNK